MFDWAFALAILPDLAKASWVTIEATAAGISIALVCGLGWALLGHGTRGVPARLAGAIVEFIRRTPLLVQMYALFYVGPNFGVTLSPFLAGTLALGLHYSAYTSEVYRAGIEGVPRGQWEAAAALNMGPVLTWRAVVLPQAIPPVIPALGNYLVAMFKETPVLAAITVMELLQTAKIVGAQTFRYLEPLTLVGVLFLIVSLAASRLIHRLERRFGAAGSSI